MHSRFHHLFSALDRRLGDLSSLIDPHATILESPSLSLPALRQLFSHEILALRVPSFLPAAAARDFSQLILSSPDIQQWYVNRGSDSLVSSQVEAAGLPHNVAVATGQTDRYFDGSVSQARRWRDDLGLRMGPFDKVRLELDEVWEDGCTIARDGPRAFVPAIPRIMRPAKRFDPSRWTKGMIHVDDLDVMRKDRGLFSANVYLQNAAVGGELEIWPLTFTSRVAMYRNAFTLSACLMHEPHAQAFLRERLPKPLVVKVEEGDLVLICTQRPHAVRGPINGGTRVSMQGFIQYESGKPLRLQA